MSLDGGTLRLPAAGEVATVGDLSGVLRTAVDSYVPFLRDDGELADPVFAEPTQYGTPYHAFCEATLALLGPEAEREARLQRAARGLDAALRHVEDPSRPPALSSFRRETGAAAAGSHREFFWPPILKTYRIVARMGHPAAPDFARRIARVPIGSAFRARPPSNWASVWMSGEWLRMREGLSPTAPGEFDRWLSGFFDGGLLVEQGLYQEPGHPNSYDLFTRYHLAHILAGGYGGAWRARLERLMVTGLSRSLAVQLSDGSLASAHRSTGQTWTLGCQCAYFTLAARWLRGREPELAARALAAAALALRAFARWQRPAAPYSPVENLLPPGFRVGYEAYTADGHYASLAMAFLAAALVDEDPHNGGERPGDDGFERGGEPRAPNGPGTDVPKDADPRPAAAVGFSPGPSRETARAAKPPGDVSARSGVAHSRRVLTFIEGDPTHRALCHCGPYSVHVNACPATHYDGFGIVDVTFGPDRLLHFVSSVRHLAASGFFNLGLGLRAGPGLSEVRPVAQEPMTPVGPITRGPSASSLRMEARAKGATHTYVLAVEVDDAGIRVEEATPGRTGHLTLLVPYLRDCGSGDTTVVTVERSASGSAVNFMLGGETVRLVLEAGVERILDLPYGYENRRGLCGLLRLDAAGGALHGLRYTLKGAARVAGGDGNGASA